MAKKPLEDPLGKAYAACRSAFTTVGFLSLFINLLMLTGPLFMLQVYDRVLASRSIPTLVALTGLVVLLYAFMGVLELIRSRILVRASKRLDLEVNEEVFDSIIRHNRKAPGKVGSRPLSDLEAIRGFISGPGPAALFDSPWMPIYIFIIYLFHPFLGYFSLAAGLILLLLALINDLVTRKYAADAMQASMASRMFIEDAQRSADVVSVLGMRDSMRNHWIRKHSTLLEKTEIASDRAGLIATISKTLRLIFQSGVLALGAYLAVLQEITPGEMIAGSILMGRALAPVDMAIAQWKPFQAARRARKTLKEVLEKAEVADITELPPVKGAIKVENLTVFGDSLDAPIIQGITFDLKAGEGLGIIGPSGAGKSTVSRALSGTLTNIRGKIRIDGATLNQWDSDKLGRYIGYLPQEVEMFNGTIAENIGRFQPDADPEQIFEACRKAHVHELILSFPDGYDTLIGHGGTRLSSGQQQRLALARALFRDPPLLILDEPTSNLDIIGETALLRAISDAKQRGATVIVIAHRPKILAHTDKVLVIQQGKQAMFGPRDKVLEEMNNMQAGGPPPGAPGQGPGRGPIPNGNGGAGVPPKGPNGPAALPGPKGPAGSMSIGGSMTASGPKPKNPKQSADDSEKA